MEYSPMLLFMLCALTPSEATVSSEGVSARVEELPQPLMSVQSFTFNHGKPFLAERDPLTGALDLRTTPVNKGASDDYLYEEFEESGESVDRKDGVASQNVISPFTKSKEAELHKFLNLPVHYASSGKYPLVSSSYANTKIQGHASNHRTSTSSTAQTPSTVAPSYYTHKTTPSTTVKTTSPTTTTTTTTTTSTTTTPPPLYEYEYEYDYSDKPSKGDYEFLGESSEVTNKNSSFFNSISDVPRPFAEQTIKTEQNLTTTSSTETPKDSDSSSSEDRNRIEKLPNYNNNPELNTPNRGSIKYHSSSTTEEPTYRPYNKYDYETTTTIRYPTSSSIVRFESPKPTTLNVIKSQLYPTSETKNNSFVVKNEITWPSTTTTITTESEEATEIKTEKPTPTTRITSTTTTTTTTTTIPTTKTAGPYGFFEENEPLTQSAFVVSTKPSENKLNVSYSDKNFGYKPQSYDVPSVSLTPPQLSQQIPVKSSYDVSDSRPTIGKPLQVQGNDVNTHDLRPPPLSLENPMRLPPSGEQSPARPPLRPLVDNSNVKRPTGMDNSLRPPGLDNSLTMPQFVLRPPLRPLPGAPQPSFRPQDIEQANSRPQILRPHHQYQRPQEEILRPHNNLNQQNGRPQENDLSRPPQLIHNQPHPSAPASPEPHRPQNIDFSLLPNINDNKPILQSKPNENSRPQRPQDLEGDYLKRPQVNHPILSSRPEGFPQRQQENNNRPFSRPVQNNEEVVWPATRPNIHKQTKPPYSFFVTKPNEKEQIKKKPLEPETVQGVGSVESVNIGQPSKVQSHFIQVSPGQENPSYSLQTSFSIGVPPPALSTAEGTNSGLIHFPPEEPLKKFPPRPQWDMKHPVKQRHPLPNILPQFRPNAKIGHAEPPLPAYVKEPSDSLQPPPLPRPEFLRAEEPLVHRRNGQSHVTTLQMMQTPLRGNLRAEDKDEPVFVVYPSNGGEGVVVGTRGPQRPLPPDNLNINDDTFPLENEDFKARVDTPILKSKPSKPLIKNDFPYPLIKPEPEEEEKEKDKEKEKIKITSTSKEYTAFSPTVPSVEKENNAEINIIPYLQDYMPFATKKPQPKEPLWAVGSEKPQSKEPLWAVGSENKPISVTLNTKSTTPVPLPVPNHKQPDTGPTPLDFQAPFQASLTAPNRGWSVVKRTDNEIIPASTQQTTTELSETTQESVFDAQNFKPQLFGGFKPILPPDDIKPLNEQP